MIRAGDGDLLVRLGPGLVRLRGAPPALARAMESAFDIDVGDPDPGDAGGLLILEIEARRRLRPPAGAERQGDAGDGVITATEGDWTWWRSSGRWAAVAPARRPTALQVDAAEPVWRLLPVIRSAARRSLPALGAIAVHASLVEVGGRGILLAGWSEAGKTEVGLALAAALGGRLAGDKWTIVRAGHAWTVPGVAGLRGWVVPYLHEDLAPLGGLHRMRLGSDRLIDASLHGLSRARAIHPLLDILGQPAGRLLPLVPTVRRTPARLMAAPGPAGPDPVPLAAAVLLLTGDVAPALRDLPPDQVLERMLLTTLHEERLVLDLASRAAYGGTPWFSPEPAREALAASLGGVPLHAIGLRFPADPRPAAALLAPLL